MTDDEHAANAVRPYTLTAGRTRGLIEVPVEAVVAPTDAAAEHTWNAGDARGKVVLACTQEPLSVAELAVKTEMALGVARVLVGDLVHEGWLQLRATMTDSTSTHERIRLIERTLRGLREL